MSSGEWWLISIAYIAPLAVAGLVYSAPRFRQRWLISAVLLGLPAFYILHYHGLQTYQGWPSNSTLPESFRLEAFKIIEPQPRSDGRGAIILWISTRDEHVPRAYHLEYQRSLHSELVSAGQRQAQGKPQIGRAAQHRSAGESGKAPIRFSNDLPVGLPAKEDAASNADRQD